MHFICCDVQRRKFLFSSLDVRVHPVPGLRVLVNVFRSRTMKDEQDYMKLSNAKIYCSFLLKREPMLNRILLMESLWCTAQFRMKTQRYSSSRTVWNFLMQERTCLQTCKLLNFCLNFHRNMSGLIQYVALPERFIGHLLKNNMNRFLVSHGKSSRLTRIPYWSWKVYIVMYFYVKKNFWVTI